MYGLSWEYKLCRMYIMAVIVTVLLVYAATFWFYFTMSVLFICCRHFQTDTVHVILMF